MDEAGRSRGAMGVAWGDTKNGKGTALAIGNFSNELKSLYWTDAGEVFLDESPGRVSVGALDVRPQGKPDITILCYGGMLPEVESAVDTLFDLARDARLNHRLQVVSGVLALIDREEGDVAWFVRRFGAAAAGGSQTSDLISESADGRRVMEIRQWVAVCAAVTSRIKLYATVPTLSTSHG